MRKFKITQDTWLKLTNTKQSSDLRETERVFIAQDSIIEVEDRIEESNGHFKIGLECFIFKDHLLEIKEAVTSHPPNLSDKEIILRECQKQGITDKRQIAYIMATVEWETNRTFKPVREAYWKNEQWRKENLRYFPYYGRGYVQLTWKSNYAKIAYLLKLDLVNNPDMVMQPNIAAFILVYGFKHGTFTGKKISDYINPLKADFINARRCINGTDKATEIAKLVPKYL